MRNADAWRPSKYVLRGARLRGTRDVAEVSVGSRLIADVNAERYSQLLPRFARGVLLDLGCGKVPLYAIYREHVSEVICADWPASLHGSRHVDVACDAGKPLPFRDATFDTVLASDVLEHVYDARKLVSEVARILKPGGHFIINTPFMYRLHEIPHDYYRLTSFALGRMFTDAGLNCVLMESCGDAAVVLADVIGKCAAELPLVGGLVATTVQSCMFHSWRRRRDRRASAYPIAHFAVAARPQVQT